MNVPTHETPTVGSPTRLLAEFPVPNYEQWRSAAEQLLKGAPFEKKLITRTPEGIDLQPIYHAEDVAHLPLIQEMPGAGSRMRASRASGPLARGWEASQELALGTPEEFNAAALQDLARGQSELNIPLDLATLAGRDPDSARPGEVGACGLSLATVADMEKAFAGIHLPMISVYLHAGASGLPAAGLLLALARKRGVPTRELRGCIEIDPLGMLAWKGDLPVSLERAYQEMASITLFAVHQAPGMQTVAVSGTPYADAGATAVQELAFVLATGVEYLREVGKHGVSIDDAARHARISLAAGGNFFMEVAKFRAVRQLWSVALEALGASEEERRMHLHVRTTTYNKTAYDAHVNMLRTTTEAFSGVVGGCDSLHVGPFDEVIRVPDEFSRRIARNTQTILAEECELNRVIDPAGGSYYVEWLTNEVATRAWALFQDIEKRGGMAKALADGYPQELVAASAKSRAEALAKRRSILIGTNQYANARESRPVCPPNRYEELHARRARQLADFRTAAATEADTFVLNGLAVLLEAQPRSALEATVEALLHGATLGEICRTLRGNDAPPPKVTPLRIHRAAEPFERLRNAAARDGQPPLLFQANIGPSRLYRLRADWTTGFFEVGGFKVLADRDFTSAEEAAASALNSGARIVVITSSDDTYASAVEPVARGIKSVDADIHVMVAGAPKDKDNEAAWRAAGVDEFVNVTSNTLEMLTRLLTKTGTL